MTGAIIVPSNPPSYFFISCFTVSFAPSINKPDFSSDSTILVISFISSFEMNKVNILIGLKMPFPLIYLFIYLCIYLFIYFQFYLLHLKLHLKVYTNSDKESLAKGTARSVSVFYPPVYQNYLYNLTNPLYYIYLIKLF